MKAAILWIYMSCIVIFQSQADVQENDLAGLCKQCKGAALPKCESTDIARLRKKIECQSEGCNIGMVVDSETKSEFMCLIDDESQKSDGSDKKKIGPQANTLPVPVALQMVATTESSKAAFDSAEAVEVSEVVTENVNVADQQVGENVPAKAWSEETTDKQKEDQSAGNEEQSAEKMNESKPTEEEIKEDQAINSGKEESADVSAQKEVAESESTVQGEPEDIPNSPDYPADAPALDVDNSYNEKQPHPADGDSEPSKSGNNVPEPSKQQQRNASEVKQMSAADKGDMKSNSGEQADVNESGGHNSVVEHNDNTVQVSEVEGDKPTHDAGKPVGPEPIGTLVPVVTPAAPIADQLLACYSCSSTTDARCAAGPGKTVNCKAMEGKQNGCYTLYKADTNVTTRGCITELTEDGVKYCMSNSKKCILCYEKDCNNLLAPSSAVRSTEMMSFLLGIASLMCFTFLF